MITVDLDKVTTANSASQETVQQPAAAAKFTQHEENLGAGVALHTEIITSEPDEESLTHRT